MSNLEEYKEFLGDLGFRESSGNPRKINEGGYIGLFQFGEAALKDIGIYTEEKEADKDYKKRDWIGSFTGKYGIDSRETFLSSPDKQVKAITAYHRILEKRIKDNWKFDKYIGQTIGGIKITFSGMIAGAHLLGGDGLKNFFNSNGKDIGEDNNKTPITEYLHLFQGYGFDAVPAPDEVVIDPQRFTQGSQKYFESKDALIPKPEQETLDNYQRFLIEFAAHMSGSKDQTAKGHRNLFKTTSFALDDAEVYQIDKEQFTGKFGIHSWEGFLSSYDRQVLAVTAYHRALERSIKHWKHKYIGKKIAETPITFASMIAAAHRFGASRLKTFLTSTNEERSKNENGPAILKYLRKYQHYHFKTIPGPQYVKIAPSQFEAQNKDETAHEPAPTPEQTPKAAPPPQALLEHPAPHTHLRIKLTVKGDLSTPAGYDRCLRATFSALSDTLFLGRPYTGPEIIEMDTKTTPYG